MTGTCLERLTPEQLDGLACVACATDLAAPGVPSVPVGHVNGGQVFACRSCAGPA